MQNTALISLKDWIENGKPWGVPVEGYVARQNIEHLRAMLKNTTDPEKRRMIEKLLLEEEAKLKKYDEDHKKA